MIKGILALLLALSISAEAVASKRKAEDEDSETRVTKSVKAKKVRKEKIGSILNELPYEYLDEKPKSECIFTLDFSDKEWESDEEYHNQRLGEIFNNIELILKSELFTNTDSFTGSVPKKMIGLFGRLISEKLKNGIIIACQYNARSLSPSFEKSEFMVDDRIKRPIKYKWDIKPKKGERRDYHRVSCTDLSWKWVDVAIHRLNRDTYSYKEFINIEDELFLRSLYNNIKRKGLENVLIRISVVANRNSIYCFNIIYSNKKELIKGKKFLLNLKNNIKNKYKFI